MGLAARRTFQRHFTIDRFATRFAALLEETSRAKVTPPASAQSNYERWIAAFDAASATDRINLCRRVRRLQRHPLISVLLPVYNPDLGLLEAAIDVEDAQKLEEKIRSNEFTLDDFRDQLKTIRKMGPLEHILGMLPGMGNALAENKPDEKQISRIEAIAILALTDHGACPPALPNGGA